METKEFNELYGRYVDTSGISRKTLDLSYGPHERNRLDIYYPESGEGPWPVIVFFHGGAFFKGDKGRYQLKPVLAGLEMGYAVASVNYRLAPHDVLPGAFADARMAVQYLKAQAAELALDADRMALWGESAGATLACFTGLVEKPPFPHDARDCSVKAIVDWYAPIDQLSLAQPEQARKLYESLFGLQGEELLRAVDAINPVHYLHESIPPVFIEHGDCDSVVPLEQSLNFRAELCKYLPENQVPLYIQPGADHGVAAFENAENLERVFTFLECYLKG